MSSEIMVTIGIFVFIFALYKVLQPARARKKAAKIARAAVQQQAAMPKLVITSSDISAIAGDDVMATQLDLARAYVETGRHLLAKKILDHVREHGNQYQQREARELLKSI
jgi:FimV-like protein